jgi:hypothetical protein
MTACIPPELLAAAGAADGGEEAWVDEFSGDEVQLAMQTVVAITTLKARTARR